MFNVVLKLCKSLVKSLGKRIWNILLLKSIGKHGQKGMHKVEGKISEYEIDTQTAMSSQWSLKVAFTFEYNAWHYTWAGNDCVWVLFVKWLGSVVKKMIKFSWIAAEISVQRWLVLEMG